MRFFATISATLIMAIPAFAESNCPAIENDLDRLACYDKEAGRTPMQEADVDGVWIVETQKSEFKDTTDVFLRVASEKPVQCGQFRGPSHITLFLRCMENTTAIMIYGDCHFASGFRGYGKVEYRIDDQTAGARNFEASTDSEALGLWSGGRSIPFIRNLFGGKQLLLRATPFNQSPISMKFNITGLEEAITPLRESCGW